MEDLFEILLESTSSNRVVSSYEQDILKNIDDSILRLKKFLSKKEKKMLLRIIDNEGLLLEETALRNFTIGFKLSVKFGIELEKK